MPPPYLNADRARSSIGYKFSLYVDQLHRRKSFLLQVWVSLSLCKEIAVPQLVPDCRTFGQTQSLWLIPVNRALDCSSDDRDGKPFWAVLQRLKF